MLKQFAAAALSAIMSAPAVQAFPVVGGQGLTPDAWALTQYIADNYPEVQSIGGIRPCDSIGEHCRGVAVDIMIGGNLALGDAIYADLSSHMGQHSIRYLLFRQPQHWDHIHATVFG